MFAEQCVVFYRMTIRKHHPTNAIGKIRDARFCVSRGRSAYVGSILSHVYVGMGQDGRRKILRLYFGLPTYNIALFTCIRQSQQLNNGLLSDCGHLISHKNAKARAAVHIYSAAISRE